MKNLLPYIINSIRVKINFVSFNLYAMKKNFASLCLLSLMSSGIILAQIPTNGLIGKYSFNGNADNEVGNIANGIVSGATLTTNRCGIANSAYYFAPPNDYISISNFRLLTDNEVSFSLWAKADLLTSNCMVMLAPDNFQDRCLMCAEYHASPSMVIWDYGDCYSGGRTIVDGVSYDTDWHHYVFTVSISQNEKKIFRDSVCISSQPFQNSLVENLREIYIGGGTDWSGGGINFRGSIDDIRIYNRGLSGNEVEQLYLENACSTAGFELYNSSNSENQIRVYPNPVHDILVVDGMEQNSSIEIMNAQTQTIKSLNFTNTCATINLSKLSRGVYTIKIESDRRITIKRFVKQ